MKRAIVISATVLSILVTSPIAIASTGTKEGRFQLFQASGSQNSIYMIDSQTGNLWVGASAPERGTGDNPVIWMKLSVEGISLSDKQLQRILAPSNPAQ